MVFRTLKYNGYKTISIVKSNYYYPHTYAYLDESDIDGGFWGVRSLHPLYELNHSLHKRVSRYLLPQRPDRPVEDSASIIQEAVRKARSGPQPFFITFKGGANHTDSAAYSWRDRDQWTNGHYQRLYEKGVREAMAIIEDIRANDPGAIVILLGDHGAWRLRGIWREPGVTDLVSLERFLAEQDLSLEDLAADIFGVFAAIHVPENLETITRGNVMAPINLFRHIFAGLAQDARYLRYSAPAVSRLDDYRLVVNGTVQHAVTP